MQDEKCRIKIECNINQQWGKYNERKKILTSSLSQSLELKELSSTILCANKERKKEFTNNKQKRVNNNNRMGIEHTTLSHQFRSERMRSANNTMT